MSSNFLLKRLLFLRSDKNITLEELAKLIGTTKQTIYKYENGIITNIPYEKVYALAKALNTTPDYLMGFTSSNDKSISYNKETGILTIPFINQKLSAGIGEDFLSDDDDISIKKIDILDTLTKGVDKDSLVCAQVKGDSMIDANLYSGDLVIFSKGLINQEGIYVLSLCNEVLIKRLTFDKLDNTITIISENKKYPQKTVNADNENLIILGKVVGWIHGEPV